MTPQEKIKEARRLLFEATKKSRQIGAEEKSNEPCRCGHKRKDHSVSYSINYTGGVCSKCKCLNYLQSEKKIK